ncbi:MAG TPA: lysophospholipid acyltransferase family protein [Burkholderiales bacterium]|jgi:KDO2-lipid IV(A) lauroyltransferase
MLLALLRLTARLPLSWFHRAGAVLGWLVYACSPTYAERMRTHLYASGVCSGDAQCKALLRRAIAETGKGMLELIAVWFGADEKVARLAVACDGWEVVEAARARGKGIIIVTPHLGCFEMVSLYFVQRLPMTVMYREPRVAWLEPFMIAGRSRWQATVAPANLRGVRKFYRTLQQKGTVGMLPDQTPGAGEGVWADFFGRPAYTMTLPVRLQRTTGAAVIMVFAERLERGRGYHLHFQELSTERFDEAALNRAIEAQIRRRPEQYLWSYHRYKARAGAEAPPARAAS